MRLRNLLMTPNAACAWFMGMYLRHFEQSFGNTQVPTGLMSTSLQRGNTQRTQLEPEVDRDQDNLP
jgi:hypothetical protein